MPDPIYTYVALAFIVGVAVGVGLCQAILRMSEKNLIEARNLLAQSIDKAERATEFYQSAVRETDRGIREVLRIAQERKDDA